MDIMYIQVKKRPKENTWYKCLSLIMLDSVVKVNKKYHPEKLESVKIKRPKWRNLSMMI